MGSRRGGRTTRQAAETSASCSSREKFKTLWPRLCDPEDVASAGTAYSTIGFRVGAPVWTPQGRPQSRGCVLGGVCPWGYREDPGAEVTFRYMRRSLPTNGQLV